MSKQYKVILVEDDESLRTLYKEAFTHNNFEVVEAEDGQLGVDYTLQTMPDVIILDLMLPRQGGLSVLRILRSHPDTKNIPIIIMTALPNPEYQDVAKGKVQAYFLKTQVKPQELVDKALELLKDK
ncbi:response regulator [Candidatus Berkelbacteria bacterium]|nr:response regulator [Candidatus Berkelbacteria bacterium]